MDGSGYLTLKNVNGYYGKTQILHEISMEIEEGGITCLVGRIGAGKTTCFRAIMGMIPSSGNIEFKKENIGGKQTYEIARMGLGYVPEDRGLYHELTVEDNLKVGTKGSIEEEMKSVYELFPQLKERRNLKSKSLSGGEQQMLSIARMLMHRPKLLMIDEAFEGLALPVRKKLAAAFQEMKAEKITIFMAEADLSNVKPVADKIYLIDRGKIIFHGDVQEVERFINARSLL